MRRGIVALGALPTVRAPLVGGPASDAGTAVSPQVLLDHTQVTRELDGCTPEAVADRRVHLCPRLLCWAQRTPCSTLHAPAPDPTAAPACCMQLFCCEGPAGGRHPAPAGDNRRRVWQPHGEGSRLQRCPGTWYHALCFLRLLPCARMARGACDFTCPAVCLPSPRQIPQPLRTSTGEPAGTATLYLAGSNTFSCSPGAADGS